MACDRDTYVRISVYQLTMVIITYLLLTVAGLPNPTSRTRMLSPDIDYSQVVRWLVVPVKRVVDVFQTTRLIRSMIIEGSQNSTYTERCKRWKRRDSMIHKQIYTHSNRDPKPPLQSEYKARMYDRTALSLARRRSRTLSFQSPGRVQHSRTHHPASTLLSFAIDHVGAWVEKFLDPSITRFPE